MSYSTDGVQVWQFEQDVVHEVRVPCTPPPCLLRFFSACSLWAMEADARVAVLEMTLVMTVMMNASEIFMKRLGMMLSQLWICDVLLLFSFLFLSFSFLKVPQYMIIFWGLGWWSMLSPQRALGTSWQKYGVRYAFFFISLAPVLASVCNRCQNRKLSGARPWSIKQE